MRYCAPSEPEKQFAVTAAPLAPVLLSDHAAIEQATRLMRTSVQIARGDRRFFETDGLFAEASFFDVFSFPLRAGDARTALAEPHTLVLSETMARKYFGEGDPVGQTLMIEDGQAYTVTGVLAPRPGPSHLAFDFLQFCRRNPKPCPLLDVTESMATA